IAMHQGDVRENRFELGIMCRPARLNSRAPEQGEHLFFSSLESLGRIHEAAPRAIEQTWLHRILEQLLRGLVAFSDKVCQALSPRLQDLTRLSEQERDPRDRRVLLPASTARKSGFLEATLTTGGTQEDDSFVPNHDTAT